MLNIAIVEDNTKDIEVLQAHLEQFSKENQVQVETHIYRDGLDIFDDYRPIYDLILLDIEMKHLDGISTAEKIRKTDRKVLIMFITNLAQYAIRGYEVDALDYVLKPINYYAFFGNSLDNAIESVNKIQIPEKRVIAVTMRNSNKMLYLQFENYFEDKIIFKEGLPITSKDSRYHG